MTSQLINEISISPIPVFYRKELGKNAYGDNIGKSRLEWLVRARTDGGLEGLTIANRYMRQFVDFYRPEGTFAGLIQLLRESLLGRRVDEFLEVSGGRATGVKPSVSSVFRDHGWMSILAYDLAAKELGISCIDLLGGQVRDRIGAYETTLYFQDILDPEMGPAKVAEEAAEAYQSGYREFKIKTGRGGRWMMPDAGMRRDVEVVLAVREAVGPEARIMVDANFGYDGRLDLLEDFVRETLSATIFWLEEMITADVGDYKALRQIQERVGSEALLVCGEVDRDPISPVFQDLIDKGLIDGYQPDVVGAGYAGWQDIERKLEGTGVRSIPHNFGNGLFGTRADIIFGAASKTFASLEDERHLPHVYKDDGFVFESGSYKVADVQGLGLEVDDEVFNRVHAKHEVVITA